MPPRTNDHTPGNGRGTGPTGLTDATEPTVPSGSARTRPATGDEPGTSPENDPAAQPGDAPSDRTAARDNETTTTLSPADPDTPAESRDPTGNQPQTGPEAAGSAVRTFPPEPRGAAPRRFSATVLHSRGARLTLCAALLAVAMTAGAVIVGSSQDKARTDATAAVGAPATGVLAGGDLDAGIGALQSHLRSQPKDFGGWAGLGLAYVEQARVKGDPSRYPQADRAFNRSLGIEPGNEQALAGHAALAAARHDFSGALEYADRALLQNPYSERALSSRIDALVELGRYDEAAEAADTADSRRPGVPVFTRYAYVKELRGDVRTARKVLEQALSSASAPADVAYVATALGQLSWSQGDYEIALTHFGRALATDEEYLPALEGLARAQAASGDRTDAIKTLEQVVARSPLPGPLVTLGELYEVRGADGDRAKAADQYALVDAQAALARAGGVNVDLDTALAAADHGDPEAALRAARDEWARRHSVHTADALAWALHRNGRSKEALPYARRATATGYRNATFLHHLGMIERATGHDADARRSLTAALELNPGFSPLGARAARAALDDLEAAR